MNLYLLQINALKLLINDYDKYIFILLFSFLLSREVLLDIPMKNDSRVPFKIGTWSISMNAFVHSLLLTILIYVFDVLSM
tara:strand:+ start:1957 stop:2196 length:240 start_codon:yes stop_codon:yes gene_type:complete